MGSAVESVGLGRVTVRLRGRGEARPAAPAAARDRTRAGAHLCGPLTATRPPACDSLQSPEISELSACGNVVWRKVAPRPRAPAPPPPGPPPPAPSSSPPSAGAPRRPPPRTGRAVAHPPPEQTWSSLAGLLGRNLGQLGVEAASSSWSWRPGAGRASGSSGAGEGAGGVWRVLLGGTERTCCSVWSENCSVAGGGERLRRLPAVLGTRAGWGPRDMDPWTQALGT